jgi:hypothetical protein
MVTTDELAVLPRLLVTVYSPGSATPRTCASARRPGLVAGHEHKCARTYADEQVQAAKITIYGGSTSGLSN